jgi:hypothetical protein
MQNERIEQLVRKYTASKTLDELLNAAGGYRPSIRCLSARTEEERAELTLLADAYDTAQELRGDPRRAYRS